MTDSWGASTPISMPQPTDDDVLVPMFGFGYTKYGIRHDLTSEDYMRYRRPTFAPASDPSNEIFEDEWVDDSVIVDEGEFL
jgi:hypothetical protein